MKAVFRHDGNALDHTPGSAVAAGDVVLIGSNLVTIARLDIAANRMGAVHKNGVYNVVKDNSDITAGDPAYWDADGDPVGGTAGSGAFTKNGALGPFAGYFIETAGTTAGDVLLDLNSMDAGLAVARSALTEDSAAAYRIPLTSFKVHDALITNLPGTAAADDMALITGTPGTDSPTLQGVDFGGTTTDEKGSFEFVLPPEYVAGQPVTLRARAAMLTTVSDGTATLDCECWKDGDDGAAGSDICATAAQSINSLTPANKSFTITPTGLVPGDKLVFRLSFGGSDTGNAGVMIPEISRVDVLLDIKG